MKKIYFSILTTLFALIAVAQEKKAEIDVDINKTVDSGNWYASPWIWVVGAAIFILLLVALMRGRSTSD